MPRHLSAPLGKSGALSETTTTAIVRLLASLLVPFSLITIVKLRKLDLLLPVEKFSFFLARELRVQTLRHHVQPFRCHRHHHAQARQGRQSTPRHCHRLLDQITDILQVEELLTIAAKAVKANEPGTLRYHLQREVKGDAPTFVMLET